MQEGAGLGGVVGGLGEDEICPSFELAAQVLDLGFGIGRGQVQGAADEETGGLANVGAGVIEPGVEALLDELNEARGHQVVIIIRVGIIADGGGIAHDHEDIAHIQSVGGEQVTLHAQQVASAGGEM